jgi:hypothetical protein
MLPRWQGLSRMLAMPHRKAAPKAIGEERTSAAAIAFNTDM